MHACLMRRPGAGHFWPHISDRMRHERRAPEAGASGLKLAPAALGASISVQQHLKVERDGRIDDLDVALQVDPDRSTWSAWRSASAC
jgi:hypothetical protein